VKFAGSARVCRHCLARHAKMSTASRLAHLFRWTIFGYRYVTGSPPKIPKNFSLIFSHLFRWYTIFGSSDIDIRMYKTRG
jgi:hypothetical protein